MARNGKVLEDVTAGKPGMFRDYLNYDDPTTDSLSNIMEERLDLLCMVSKGGMMGNQRKL